MQGSVLRMGKQSEFPTAFRTAGSLPGPSLGDALAVQLLFV